MKNLGGSIGWGSDVPISMPEPMSASQAVEVDMSAFAFTRKGMAHNLRAADLEVYETPLFAPEPFGLMGGELLP